MCATLIMSNEIDSDRRWNVLKFKVSYISLNSYYLEGISLADVYLFLRFILDKISIK